MTTVLTPDEQKIVIQAVKNQLNKLIKNNPLGAVLEGHEVHSIKKIDDIRKSKKTPHIQVKAVLKACDLFRVFDTGLADNGAMMW